MEENTKNIIAKNKKLAEIILEKYKEIESLNEYNNEFRSLVINICRELEEFINGCQNPIQN